MTAEEPSPGFLSDPAVCPRQDRSGHLDVERNGLLRPLEFVKLESFARKGWTWEINALSFAKLICEMGARKWLSLDMQG
jgi:hypothetical protein